MSNNPKLKPPNSFNIAVKCESCVLSHLCIAASLTSSEIKQLDTVHKNKVYLEKDDALFQEGDSTHKIYAVSSGSLKTTSINKNGVEQITGFYLPGDILGLEGLADMKLNSTASAIETSTVCALSEQEFDRLCETNHGLRRSFMRLVSKEISSEQRMMMALGQMKSDEKLASFLISLSARYKERGYSPTEFNLSMKRHDIANYLGLTIETISRLFKAFNKQGLIEVNNRLVILTDRQALCDIGHASCFK